MMSQLIPHGGGGFMGTRRAAGMVYQMLQQQAGMLAYVDCFFAPGDRIRDDDSVRFSPQADSRPSWRRRCINRHANSFATDEH